MKITITGSLGHVGKPLASQLIEKGHQVTVVSSNYDKKTAIESLGARAAIGLVTDPAFLTSVFEGADAVFVMIPPNITPDSRTFYNAVGNSYAEAISNAHVPRVVHLSSWGAHLPEGTGFILGSHDVEGILNRLPGVSITHLRPGSFYYNLFGFISMIKHAGVIGSNYGGDDKIVMAAPQDIADAATWELTTAGSGIIRYIASDDITASDAARILGEAIGKPGLQWLTFSEQQTLEGLLQAGFSRQAAEKLIELNAAIHSGAIREDYDLHIPEKFGKVKIADFAKEFAAVYYQK